MALRPASNMFLMGVYYLILKCGDTHGVYKLLFFEQPARGRSNMCVPVLIIIIYDLLKCIIMYLFKNRTKSQTNSNIVKTTRKQNARNHKQSQKFYALGP